MTLCLAGRMTSTDTGTYIGQCLASRGTDAFTTQALRTSRWRACTTAPWEAVQIGPGTARQRSWSAGFGWCMMAKSLTRTIR